MNKLFVCAILCSVFMMFFIIKSFMDKNSSISLMSMVTAIMFESIFLVLVN